MKPIPGHDEESRKSGEEVPGDPDGVAEEAEEGPVDSSEELVFRKSFLSSLKERFSYSLFTLALIAIPIGVLAAYGATGFRLVFGLLSDLFHRDSGIPPGIQELLTLIGGGLVFGGILQLLKWDRFRTPAHVIVAVSEREGKIPLRDGVITAVADALSIGMGAPVGRYGTAVHLGATLGSVVARMLRLGKNSVTILLGCGVAAAISASFDAPIAGVIFAHEVIIGHFKLRAFAPITLASVAAVAIVHFHRLEYVALKLSTEHHALDLADYPVYLGIGLLAAGVAFVYMAGINRTGWMAQKSGIPLWMQPAIGGAIAGVIGIGIPEMLGLGDDTILLTLGQSLEAPELVLSSLILIGVGKLAGSVACLGLRYPGGSFGPAIFIGSMLGAVIGMLFPWLDYKIAILVGMGAMVSSVVGAPLATILIVFEMTRDYGAATAVMAGVVSSNAVVTRYYARSLFHRQIRLWGIDITKPEEQRILQGDRVSEVMHANYIAVRPDRSVADLRKMVDHGYRGEVFVIDGDRRLLGGFSLTTLAISGEDETAGELAETPEIILRESDSAWSGFVRLENFEGMSVPVVDNVEENRLVGAVYPSDFVKAYRRAIEESRESGN